jgi:predicted amidophosphoribosyltransferase
MRATYKHSTCSCCGEWMHPTNARYCGDCGQELHDAG